MLVLIYVFRIDLQEIEMVFFLILCLFRLYYICMLCYNFLCYFYQNVCFVEVELVLLVLGQVYVIVYFNQDEDIGEEDQVLNFFVKKF